MNKSKMKKIVLQRETIRNLGTAQLGRAVGGRMNETIVSQCDCPTFTQDDAGCITTKGTR